MFIALTFAAIFSILCNARILADAMKGKWKLAGSSVAHIGFALLLVGALVAAATNKVISVNSSGVIPVAGFEKADKPGDNLMLYQNQPAKMDGFVITYLSDTTIGPNTYYKINYKLLDEASGKVKEEFNLYPNAQQNPKMGLVASPDTKHYLTYDIYTHINAAPQLEKPESEGHDHEGHSEDEHYEKPATHEVSPGDTVRIRNGYIVVKGINNSATIAKIPLGKGDAAVALQLEAVINGRSYPAEPLFLIKGGNNYDFAKLLEEPGLKLRFTNIYPEKQKFELMVYQKPEAPKKWVVMKAIKFPYINLFWGGTIIMVIGFLLSIFRRSKESKTA